MRKLKLARGLCLWLTTLIACLTLSSAPAGENKPLLVFAAASLKDSMDTVISEYQKHHTLEIRASYAASSTLARQIESGAPVDIYISANEQWMDYLGHKNLIQSTSRNALLGNRLVLIAPAGKSAELRISKEFPLSAALDNKRLALADPDHVPAGIYAREALINLGVWHSLEKKFARTENVRAALALVSLNETPLGIVYRTDALADKNVSIVDSFPEACHTPIIYSSALISGRKSTQADQFYEFLTSDEAAALFGQFGFTRPGNNQSQTTDQGQ